MREVLKKLLQLYLNEKSVRQKRNLAQTAAAEAFALLGDAQHQQACVGSVAVGEPEGVG